MGLVVHRVQEACLSRDYQPAAYQPWALAASPHYGYQPAALSTPGFDVLPPQGANVYDILRRDTLVLTKNAIELLEARLT